MSAQDSTSLSTVAADPSTDMADQCEMDVAPDDEPEILCGKDAPHLIESLGMHLTVCDEHLGCWPTWKRVGHSDYRHRYEY